MESVHYSQVRAFLSMYRDEGDELSTVSDVPLTTAVKVALTTVDGEFSVKKGWVVEKSEIPGRQYAAILVDPSHLSELPWGYPCLVLKSQNPEDLKRSLQRFRSMMDMLFPDKG